MQQINTGTCIYTEFIKFSLVTCSRMTLSQNNAIRINSHHIINKGVNGLQMHKLKLTQHSWIDFNEKLMSMKTKLIIPTSKIKGNTKFWEILRIGWIVILYNFDISGCPCGCIISTRNFSP